MLPPQQEAACAYLFDLWEHGERADALPETLRPVSRQDGYAVQARIEARSAAPLFGWKIAATSAAGQAHIGVDGPLAGRLLAERAYRTGATLPFGRNHMRVAEPEFAFRMGADILPRGAPYSVAEVMAAVGTLHPAIEVPDSRYEDFARVGAPQLIADNACAHLFVLGEAAPEGWREHDLAQHAVVAQVEGGEPSQGRGANVLGDPRIALTWLANELSGLSIPLRAGQVVTTGTCMTPLPIAPGDTVAMDAGVLGGCTARFGA